MFYYVSCRPAGSLVFNCLVSYETHSSSLPFDSPSRWLHHLVRLVSVVEIEDL